MTGPNSRLRAILLALLVGSALGGPVRAEAGPAPAPDQDTGQDAIVVTGHPLRDMSLMAGSVELQGDQLLRVATPQIGELLARLPGVSATSFAPGVSRPVLRGQTGDRVLVLVDGIGSIDASSVSADHGVALDALTIDHVDVLHGPAVLAYGGQAIGGAVVAYDKRIPRAKPDGIDFVATAGFASASDEKSLGASADVPLAGNLVGHIDASWHRANDLRVGGELVSPALQAQLAAQAAELRSAGDNAAAAELDGQRTASGRVPNSFSRGSSVGAGLAWIGDGGSTLGISVQRLDSRYGIPARPGAGEDGVAIDLGQTRVDLRGEAKLSGFLDSVNLRAAWADYRHAELEDGIAGTRLSRKGGEARLELVQADHDGWTGRSGVQFSTGKLDVTGAEAILPANRDTRIGLFTLQSLRLGKLGLEAAGRFEHVGIKAASIGFDRGFSLVSGAAGLAWYPQERWKIGLNFTHGERAPSAEELLTDGVHVATQAYETGDPAFRKERSNGLEAYVRYDGDGTRFSASAYRTDFSGFITPVPTGATREGVPEYLYRQLPARFQGFEVQAAQVLARWGSQSVSVDASGDYVHAELKGNGPVPRIPPLRLQGGVEFATPALTLRGEVEWNDAQKRTGAFENPTAAFTLVNVNATWRPMGERGPLTLVLSADNLFDAVGRRSASFTRDFVPVAGRDLRVTAKLSF